MKGLTEKQKNMVDFIAEFTETMGMTPTIYEIAEHFQIKTSTVFAHIRALQKKGILTRCSKARSIKLNHPQKRKHVPAGIASVPLMNSANSTYSNIIFDSKVFPHIQAGDKELFAMHIQGTGLRSLGFLDGDIVILKSHPRDITNGDIVLTELNGKDVFRSFRILNEGDMRLSPGEDDLVATGKIGDFPIKGRVVGLQRNF